MNRRARAALAVAALAAVLTTGAAAPAQAHTGLERSDPLQGARLSKPPAAAVLTFGGDVRSGAVRTRLVDPDGATTPAARVDGPAVVVPVRDAGPGAYRIEYRVVSGDGHAMSGTLTFEVYVPQLVAPTAPATPAATVPPTPVPSTPSTIITEAAPVGLRDEGPSGWLVGGLAAAGLVGAGGAAVLATRRGGSGS